MKVKMLKNEKGSPDGLTVVYYKEGSEYDLTDRLAEVFIGMGVAEEAEKKKPVVEENKAIEEVKEKKIFKKKKK